MAQNEEQQITNEQEQQQLSDMDIAKMAREEMAKRDAEIKRLEKELAKATMYTQASDEENVEMSKEDCIKVLGASDTTNYDYAVATVRLREIEIAAGRPDPLGEDGEQVSEFFKSLIEDCDGDKTAFPALYQARLGKDRPEDAAAYKQATKK